VFDDRNDKPPVERNGNADVDVLVVDNRLAVNRCVDDRNLTQSIDDRLCDERQIGELCSGSLELRLTRRSDLIQA
jgi:hypothetical protein